MEIDPKKSWGIAISTITFYFLSLFAAYYFYEKSTVLFIISAVLAGGFVSKSFIIMHDCGHGTFFKDKKTRDTVGKIFSFIAFAPYYQWANDHAAHHQTSGNLDKRGDGDIWTMTVKEYTEASRFEKLQYLAYRNPFIMFVLGGFYLFFIRFRIPHKKDSAETVRNVHYTSLVLASYLGLCFFLFGFSQTIIVTLTIYTVATGAGTFLFYVQHQYEECYWRSEKQWDYTTAALAGSSYFKMPRIFQWFTGSIGFHHIHHLNHRVPFYNLEKCYLENDCFQNVKTLDFWDALKASAIKFYDEDHERMITMAQYRKLRQRPAILAKTA